jgi:DNA-binding NarL/FixJ family response regulator
MPDPARPLIVWLVEDHKVYGSRLQRALNRCEGISCPQWLSSCEDALAALPVPPAPGAPHVLLLDVELPGMSGIEALAHFRQRAPTTALIILTVFEDDDKIFRAICAGATGYLLKTTSAADIAASIRSAADGGSPINPHIARRVLEMVSRTTAPRHDYGLSPREMQILQLLVQGHTTKQAAAELGIGYYTADEYIRTVYEKLQVHSRGGAIAKAVNEKIVAPKPP